jgi:FG-GAP repeat protein
MRYFCVLVGALHYCLTCGPAYAAAHNQTLTVFANDHVSGDQFGFSVAISGTTAIIGANKEGEDFQQGLRGGSAYLIDTTTGQELFKLVGQFTSNADDAGRSVAISGDIAVVGAPRNFGAFNGSGAAHVFDATTGVQLFRLLSSDATASDLLGWSVAVSGNTVVAGAIGNDDAGNASGSAYLFDAGTGNELFKLTASDADAGDLFGYSVAISGNTAIVGANREGDAGSISGSAYVFDATTGIELHKLTASDAGANDQLGLSVAISGDIAIVGAPGDSDAGAGSGSAYLFDTTTGEELFKLTASDSAAGDQFGSSVSISGTIAVVGAQGNDAAGSQSGSAYAFDVTTGKELFKIVPTYPEPGNLFGSAVALSGTTAIVGAYANDFEGPFTGSVHVFENIPEPTSVTLLAVGGAVLLRRQNTMACS